MSKVKKKLKKRFPKRPCPKVPPTPREACAVVPAVIEPPVEPPKPADPPKPAEEEPERRTTEYLDTFDLDYAAMCKRDSLDTERPIMPFTVEDEFERWLDGRPGRRENPLRALDRKCHTCSTVGIFHQPCAENAKSACSGCVFSYAQPTAPDASMLDVFSCFGADDTDLSARVARLRGRYTA